MKKSSPVIFCIVLFQALSVYADTGTDADTELEQLLSLSLEDLMAGKVMISTNTKQMLSKAPSVVSVITAEDIKATGATNLTDILQSVPGVYIKTNLFAFRPQVTFRGASAPQTLLMVNGEPQRDLVFSTGIFWKGLTANMIDRIEIIRGPGSALFGSDASAGVINVITKTAGRIKQSEAGVRAGSFNTQAGWVQHGGNWNDFDIGFTAEVSHTDGHNPFIQKDGQTASDASAGTNVSLAPGNAYYGYDNADIRFSMAKDNWRLLADYVRHSNLGVGLTGGAVLNPLTRASDDRFSTALLYSNEAFAKDWGLNAELRYHHIGYSSGDGFQEYPAGHKDSALGNPYPDGVLNRQRFGERGVSSEVSGLYTGLKTHAIRFGGGFSWEDLYLAEQFVNFGKNADGSTINPPSPLVDISGSPYAFAPKKARQIRYAFLQDAWTFSNDWELTAGARYDQYSDFGGTLNPRLALVWQSTDRLTSKLMYGQAFRAPSYLELYAYTAATPGPNPNLLPERSKTLDLSFSYLATKDLTLDLDFYRFAQSNLIAQDVNLKYQNMGSNTARGVELEARWQAAKTLRFAGNLSYRDETLAYNAVPRAKAYLRSDWAFMPKWNWNVQVNLIGHHDLSPGNPRMPIDSYALVDTTIRYSPLKEWEFTASLRNLFDVDAREYSSGSGKYLTYNLPQPGRSFFAEIRYRF